MIQIIGRFFLYELVVKRGPKEFLQNNIDLEVSGGTMELFLNGDWIDWVNNQNFEQLTLTSRDELKLSGYYLPAFPLLDSTSMLMKIRAGYSYKEANALNEVEKTNVPILYKYGKSDTFVPTQLTKDLYQHTSSDAELFLVPNANHGESFALAQDDNKLKIDHFLERYNK